MAWITKLLDGLEESNRKLCREGLGKAAAHLRLFPGVPQFFTHVGGAFKRFCGRAGFKGILKFHVVSGGLEVELCVWYDPIGEHLHALGYDASAQRYFHALESSLGAFSRTGSSASEATTAPVPGLSTS